MTPAALTPDGYSLRHSLRSHGVALPLLLYYDVSVDLSFHQPCLQMQQEAAFGEETGARLSSRVHTGLLLLAGQHLGYNQIEKILKYRKGANEKES